MWASTPTNFPKDSKKTVGADASVRPQKIPFLRKYSANSELPRGGQSRPPLREGEIKPLALCARGFCDRVYKPGSVIDSHLSRRIVANALQPPPRKQPGRPCFLHGVAPDRVYSNGRFHADACALTARFHPYLVGANFISFASPQAAKLIHSVAPPLPSKQGLCRLFLFNWETLFSVAQLI